MTISSNILPLFRHVRATFARGTTWYLRPCQAGLHQGTSAAAGKATEPVKDEALNTGEQMMSEKNTYSTAHAVEQKADDMARDISRGAENVAEKGKQIMQDAWDSAKQTAETMKKIAEESKEAAKDEAEKTKEYVEAKAKTVERSMNTKNYRS